jgi:MtN3 and saliva related transmembrane protein
MSMVEVVGSVAAFFTTIAFVPQVIQTWKSQHARDLSLGMFSMFTLGVLLWLVYGLLIGSWPIIIANIITAGLAGTILYFKLRFG